MDVDLRRQAEAGRLEHAGPEQRVEVRDVLADEVMNLASSAIFHQSSSFSPVRLHHCLRAGDVADRGVEPDVPVVARAIGNLEAEVRGRPRDVPVAERLAEEMALEVVGDFGLQVLARLRPLVQKAVQLLELDEQVLGRPQLGLRAAERADRVDQVGRACRSRRTCRSCRRTDRATCTWGTSPSRTGRPETSRPRDRRAG